MTRENSSVNLQNKGPSKQTNNLTSNQSTGSVQPHYQHKTVHFEPFHLFSSNDNSLRKALELVENASLNRNKVCVVSIVSKSALDDSTKSFLVQSLVSTDSNNKKRYKNKINKTKHTSSKSTSVQKPTENQHDVDLPFYHDPTSDFNYENQVIGHVDTRAGVIVLNLTSFMDSEKCHSLSHVASTLLDPRARNTQSFLSSSWPKWNQNLLKTLLILFTMSNIVIFYNPDLSIDYSLIQIFKVLETLRLKSQTRVIDLLESIATKQMFSQQWIRQGRIACPRALFVCDTTSLDVSTSQGDIVEIKRELEDQIYTLLKKLSITSRPYGSSQVPQGTLFVLPERDDFVFILKTKQQPKPSSVPCRSIDSSLLEDNAYKEFYSSLFRSLKINTNQDLENKTTMLEQNKTSSSNNNEINDCSLNNQFKLDEPSPAADSVPSNPLNAPTSDHNKFKAFVNWHISEIQSSAQVDQDNKQYLRNTLLPRYDDFFTVLIHLKSLLFLDKGQHVDQNNGSGITIPPPLQLHNWSAPDERRFIDIFDLIDHDQLFSKRHCYRTRVASLDFYIRGIYKPLSQTNHENALESAKQLYLNHARGQACLHNLDLLLEQCNSHWMNLNQQKSASAGDVKDGRGGNQQKSKAVITGGSERHVQTNGLEVRSNQKPNLTITRRANGIRMTTSCDCGRQNNYMIMPVDRKKKLERIDIHRLND